ncbi:MAG: DUF4405 domain-containing protein [Candidatus Aenigmarchaeota archaeon]|nr:DUF4405 domain-containing protein [Candidatus Aenigmarchaeota archaeon]
MKKIKLNYFVDMIMALSFMIASVSGLIFFPFSDGVRRYISVDFLGIPRNNWKIIHDWSGLILVLTVVLHLILHWKWIVCMTKNFVRRKKKDKC